jgi:threonine/homoserine/homoserine lactone efflux protein
MLENFLIGSGFAFAAALQPGPLQAFLVSRVASTGWKRTLPACLAPPIGDVPIAVLVLLVLGRLSPTVQHLLRVGGGVLLLYFAYGALRQWRNPAALDMRRSAPRTLFDAVLVNLLNPNPYLGWTLVLGPAAVSAWRAHPSHAFVLVGAFYGTLVVMLALFIFLVGTVRFLGSRGQRALLGISSLALAGIGLYLLIAGVRGLGAA